MYRKSSMSVAKMCVASSLVVLLSACGGGSSSTPVETETGGETTSGTNGGGSSTDTTAGSTDNTGNSTGGATTGGGTVTGSGNLFGTVNMEVGNDVEFDATFFAFEQAIPLAEIEADLRGSLDTCTVEVVDTSVPGDIDIPDNFNGVGFQTVSAGEVITISSPAGSYAELQRASAFGFTFYQQDEGAVLTPPVPEGLTLNIPGDVFPAVSNLAYPTVQPLVITGPAAFEPITANTTFTWVAGSNPNAAVIISAFAGTSSLDCIVADDGSFTIPAATQAQLGAGFSAFSFFMDRDVFDLVPVGNAYLILNASATGSYQ